MRQGESKIPFCNASDGSFSSNPLLAIMYLERVAFRILATFMMELLCKYSQLPKDVNYCFKKQLQMFGWMFSTFKANFLENY